MLEKAESSRHASTTEASLAEALIRLEVLAGCAGDLRAASDHARAAAPLLEPSTRRASRVRHTSSKPSGCSSAGISRTRCRRFEALGIFRLAEGATAPEAAGARVAAMAWGG